MQTMMEEQVYTNTHNLLLFLFLFGGTSTKVEHPLLKNSKDTPSSATHYEPTVGLVYIGYQVYFGCGFRRNAISDK